MDSKLNYTIVGIFVVALSVVFIVLFFWLSGMHHDKIYNIYLTYVHEDVTGLSTRSPVRFNGVQVGYVSTIELDPNNSQLVKITLKIEQGTPVTTSTVVNLLPMGVTGIIYVGLKAQTPNAPLLTAKSGKKYPVIPFRPSFLMQLSTVLPRLTDNLREISQDISKVFDKKNRKAISISLQNIATVTKNLSNSSQKLDTITDSLEEILKNTSIASKQFPEAINELQKTMKSIQQTSVQIKTAGRSANILINQGRVMLGNFNDQLLPVTQQILVKLNSVMLNFSNVTQEIQRNPSMLIRGKQPSLPGPGESQ